MKIFINATGPETPGGYFTYITNLLKNIAYLDEFNYYYVLCNGNIYKEVKSLNGNIQVSKATFFHKYALFRFFWMQFLLPIIMKFKAIKICLSPLNISPYLCNLFKIKSITVLHSNIPWTNVNYLPQGIIGSYLKKKLQEFSLCTSDLVVAVSLYAKNEIIQHTKIPENKVQVIHHGINPVNICKQNSTNKYFLYVANSAIHHNHIKLLDAFSYFLHNTTLKYQLYLVIDNIDIENYNLILLKIKTLNLTNSVKILDPVNKNELDIIYYNAVLYIFPSLMETFGMTTLESMACGTPVLCSNTSAMPEINGDAAVYFDPKNHIDISEKITSTLGSKITYDSLVEKGYKRIKEFTWENTSRKTISLFESMSN